MNEEKSILISPISNLPDWQKGWIAGFIDGEGCIGAYKIGTKWHSIHPAVTVNNTSQVSINTLYELTQLGHIAPLDKPSNCKPQWRWSVNSFVEVSILLRVLAPYMLTRRQQADLVLEFCTGNLSNNLVHDSDYYYEQTLVLNRRGTDDD